MARITVEDCEEFVPNRFELVVLAALRTRQLINGEKPQITPQEDEKKAVMALREIGVNSVSLENLREGVINKFRTVNMEETDDEDLDDLMEDDTYSPLVSMNEAESIADRPALIGIEDRDEVTIVDEEGMELYNSDSEAEVTSE